MFSSQMGDRLSYRPLFFFRDDFLDFLYLILCSCSFDSLGAEVSLIRAPVRKAIRFFLVGITMANFDISENVASTC